MWCNSLCSFYFSNCLEEERSDSEVIQLFLCSIHLSMKFQLLIRKMKYLNMKKFLALSLSDVVFIMLINVKMTTIVTIVGILTFMSRLSFV